MRIFRASILFFSFFILCSTQIHAQVTAAADLNGDGKLDVVVGDNIHSSVLVYLSNGPGTFASPASFPIFPLSGNTVISSISLADFNNDGKVDMLVFTDEGASPELLLGDGLGGFSAPISTSIFGIPQGSIVFSSIVADFNCDGFPDVATLVNVSGVTGPVLATFFGNGHGGFSSPHIQALALDDTPGPPFLTVLDINHDGIPDLVISGPVFTYNAINDGTGHFDVQPVIAGRAFLVGDLNGDGNPDYLFPQSGITLGATSQIAFGDGQGGILSLSNPLTPLLGTGIDLDNNTTLDLLFGVGGYIPGNGHGGFGDSLGFGTQTAAVIATTDVNADGRPDLVFLTNAGTPDVFVNNVTAPPTFTASTATALVASADTTSISQTVTLAGLVTSNGGTPTGTITFSENGTSLGSAPLNIFGAASLDTTFTTPGPHTVTATYSGGVDTATNTTFTSSTGGFGIFVNNTPAFLTAPTLNFAASPNPVRQANPVTFTISVSSASGTPTGEVLLRADGQVIGSIKLPANVRTLNFPAAGLHNVQATYGGDGSFPPATSAVLVEDVRALTAPRNPSTVQLTATPTGTGPVVFTLNATLSGVPNPQSNFTYQVNGTVIASSSPAGHPITFSSPSPGTFIFSAIYPGDATLLPGKATVTVTAGNPAGGFSLASGPSDMTVTAGQSVSTAIVLLPGGGFSSPTTFSCSGLPAATTCTFSPATLTPSGSAMATTLTIATTARQIAAVQNVNMPSSKIVFPLGISAILLCGLFILAPILKTPMQSRKLIGVTLGLALVIGIVSCGGGGSTPAPTPTPTPAPSPSPTPTPNGTPAGTTSITVTGTSAVATNSTQIVLTVQ